MAIHDDDVWLGWSWSAAKARQEDLTPPAPMEVRMKKENRRKSWSGVVGWHTCVDLSHCGWIIVVNHSKSIPYCRHKKMNKIS